MPRGDSSGQASRITLPVRMRWSEQTSTLLGIHEYAFGFQMRFQQGGTYHVEDEDKVAMGQCLITAQSVPRPVIRGQASDGWLAILLSCALVLGGCNDRDLVLDQPPIALTPGYITMDSGRPLQLLGYEKCPSAGYAIVGAQPTRNMEKHCTLVGRGKDQFDISVGTPQGVIVERWRVVASTEAIKLVRPNGDSATIFRLLEP